MKPYLLDVNVLIALAWPSHVHHRVARRWFARIRSAGFRTCPMTQAGFVRISSNPAFTDDAASPQGAMGLLDAVTALPEHDFWPDDLPLREAIPAGAPLLGHRQVTDAYLLGLAKARGGRLATLDRAVLTLPGAAQTAELLAG